MSKLKINIWSDVQCPFCYIGKRHLEAALSQNHLTDKVEIEYKSFQLNPDIPMHMPVKQNAYEYLSQIKGMSYEHSVTLHQRVTQMAQHAGLDYHFEKTIIANSFNAHRVLQFAKTKDLGNLLEEILFKSYFTDGKNINDPETLMEMGIEAGLTMEEVNEALHKEEYAYKVNQDIYEARQMGISGVPFFVFDEAYAVSGAQPVEYFTEVLQKIISERNEPLTSQIADACKAEGECL